MNTTDIDIDEDEDKITISDVLAVFVICVVVPLLLITHIIFKGYMHYMFWSFMLS